MLTSTPLLSSAANRKSSSVARTLTEAAVVLDGVEHLPDVLEADEQVADDLHAVGARDARQQLGGHRGLDQKALRRQRAQLAPRLDDVRRQQHGDLVAGQTAPRAIDRKRRHRGGRRRGRWRSRRRRPARCASRRHQLHRLRHLGVGHAELHAGKGAVGRELRARRSACRSRRAAGCHRPCGGRCRAAACRRCSARRARGSSDFERFSSR